MHPALARAISWAIVRKRENGGKFLAVNAGRDESNYQVRDRAEAVARQAPGATVFINTDENAPLRVLSVRAVKGSDRGSRAPLGILPALRQVCHPQPVRPPGGTRFFAYPIRSWRNDGVARVNTPDYVRDNLHVSLLAAAYAKFVSEVAAGEGRDKLNPSGYVETQGAFAHRFAAAMRPRLGMECSVELASQTDFSEPLMRVNVDSAAWCVGEWNESDAWDEAAEGYRN